MERVILIYTTRVYIGVFLSAETFLIRSISITNVFVPTNNIKPSLTAKMLLSV